MLMQNSINLTFLNSFGLRKKKNELRTERLQCLESIATVKSKIASTIISKFIGITTKKGNKNSASKIFEKSFFFLKRSALRRKNRFSLHVLFWKFFSKIKPGVKVKRTRVSGRTVYVPSGVKFNSQLGIGLRWLLNNPQPSKSKKVGTNHSTSLAQFYSTQIVESLNKKGLLLQKKEELNKLAEKNRYFLRLSW